MNSATRSLDRLVLVTLVTSVIHFTDNAVRFARFPEPHWITGPHVVIALWLAITPLLLGGWWLARHGRFGPARIALQLYAVLGLLVLGHYAYPVRMPMPISIHVGIAVNALAALALLVATPSLLRRMREG